MGALDLLPDDIVHALKAAEERTADRDGLTVNFAVGYGGRREIADAVRSLLHEHAAAGTSIEELAEVIDVDHIADHLYTKGQPDPDLVIRTSRRAAAVRASCSGSPSTRSSTSATPSGRTSARSTSCGPCATTAPASAASAARTSRPVRGARIAAR